MTGRRTRPIVPGAGKESIDQWDEGRTSDQGPEWTVGTKQAELYVEGGERDQEGEGQATGSGIRRGLRVGDHEEGEDQ